MLLFPLLMAQNTIDLYYDGRIYFITHKNTATLAWDAVPNASFYEVQESWFDAQLTYQLPSTPLTTYPIVKRRCGHFFYQVRACNYDVNNNKLCSEWASSMNIDNASVDGTKMRWLIYWGLTPPSDPVIE